MPTETKAVEIIASNSGRGQYDMRCETRLVKRDETYFLVNDEYCGEGGLRGGAYRPFVYAVPPDLVALVADLIANADEYDPEWPGYVSKLHRLRRDVIGDLQPHCLGEQRATGWQSSL